MDINLKNMTFDEINILTANEVKQLAEDEDTTNYKVMNFDK